MIDRVEEALNHHDKGYNCAQCVLLAYSDALDIDEKTAFRVAEGLGAGMGDYQGTCGALTGAILAVGLLTDGRGMNGDLTKPETYATVAELRQEFQDLVGAETCGQIRESDDHPALLSCEDCIATGVELVGRLLNKKDWPEP